MDIEHPEPFFVTLNLFSRLEPTIFVPPSGSEGSLGTGVPRDDTVGGCYHEASAEGSPPFVLPLELRYASLPLGRTR